MVRSKARRSKALRSKAQVSVEYVMIVAFTFAVLVPGIYFFYQYSQASSAGLSAAQFNRLGQEMLSTAVKTVAQGEGTWVTLDAVVPESVRNITVADSGKELVVHYQTPIGVSEAVFFSDVKLNASGLGDSTVFSVAPHSGKVSFRFTALDDGSVRIEEKSG